MRSRTTFASLTVFGLMIWWWGMRKERRPRRPLRYPDRVADYCELAVPRLVGDLEDTEFLGILIFKPRY